MNGDATPGALAGQVTLDEELPLFVSRRVPPKHLAAAADFSGIDLPGSRQQAEMAPERLAERSKAGCPDSFERLVTLYESQVFNFLRQFTGNHHDAEDLTQETFVKAYRSLHRYNSSFSFAAWLFTIARRTGASHFRSAQHFEGLSEDEEGMPETPATALEYKDERNSVWRLVRTLKPKQAEALWLRYAEGFTVAETARIMRTNQIHVKVLLHRARSNLCKIMTLRGLDSENQTSPGAGHTGKPLKHLGLKAIL